MTAALITQSVVEGLRVNPPGQASLTHVATEVLRVNPPGQASVTQVVVEVISQTPPPTIAAPDAASSEIATQSVTILVTSIPVLSSAGVTDVTDSTATPFVTLTF